MSDTAELLGLYPHDIDAINDGLLAILGPHIDGAEAGRLADQVDNLTHDVLEALLAMRRVSLVAGLERELEASGGRGVELADQIDSLNHHRTLVLRIPMIVADPDDEPEGSEVARALLDNLGDDWWTCTEGDDRYALSDGDTQVNDDLGDAASLYPSRRRPTAEVL